MLPTERLLLDAVTVLASENINMKRVLSENFPRCDFEEMSAFDVDALVRNITIQKLTATDSMSVIMRHVAEATREIQGQRTIGSMLYAPVDTMNMVRNLSIPVRQFYNAQKGIKLGDLVEQFGELSALIYAERQARDAVAGVAVSLGVGDFIDVPKHSHRVVIRNSAITGGPSIQVQKQAGLLPDAIVKLAPGSANLNEYSWITIGEILVGDRGSGEFWGTVYVEHLKEVIRTDIQEIWELDFWYAVEKVVKKLLAGAEAVIYNGVTKDTFRALVEENEKFIVTITPAEILGYRNRIGEQGFDRLSHPEPGYPVRGTPSWEPAPKEGEGGQGTLVFRHNGEAVGATFVNGELYGRPGHFGPGMSSVVQNALWASAQRQLEGLMAYVKDLRDNTDVVVME